MKSTDNKILTRSHTSTCTRGVVQYHNKYNHNLLCTLFHYISTCHIHTWRILLFYTHLILAFFFLTRCKHWSQHNGGGGGGVANWFDKCCHCFVVKVYSAIVLLLRYTLSFKRNLIQIHQLLTEIFCKNMHIYDLSEYRQLKIELFMTSPRSNRSEVKIKNNMHNYTAILVHWHHTLGCQCSSFSSYGVHKVAPVRLLIAEKLNYFMTSLRGKNEVQVKF